MRKLREVPPPRGIARLLYRLPIALYRLGLGRLLGARFLLLEHRGRRSGALRRAVLEVVRHERGTWWVVSAWGARAEWLRNLRAAPHARIETAGRTLPVEAHEVSGAEAEEVLLAYGRRHPRAIRSLARLLGWQLDGSEGDLRALASVVRVVELRSAEAPAPGGTPAVRTSPGS